MTYYPRVYFATHGPTLQTNIGFNGLLNKGPGNHFGSPSHAPANPATDIHMQPSLVLRIAMDQSDTPLFHGLAGTSVVDRPAEGMEWTLIPPRSTSSRSAYYCEYSAFYSGVLPISTGTKADLVTCAQTCYLQVVPRKLYFKLCFFAVIQSVSMLKVNNQGLRRMCIVELSLGE
ncbi:hypothetical protein PHYBLDRAFT_169715 [Phycomyces blakesleeanus NRRL 1555(-)]|uniref:Uncharacterized protein n=1 Tax=Phycomyces blakesleeanus (strain ATCC 8743b / DSM 1359 / FGSC 10004 / NBRC 33097 / NRRL 1555) TaxID=763407 RepID=A0A162PGH6_PHYB8|nr:hypothetical protein PHYBLDRAFT_169715 [Phycomyces blakesleeanus NRRL 1555(-)]OAD72587.1 hypothetical protein PHYBLDRAFT_169715 [Phycomyces blakesleeanus NRRL 1555(-)]|eukprot:XP_018290627.1 hypothetical protein PHYBLDRAFT_169715 [Phycomyces blakesleeanus NRRL 1555(-)]